MTNFGKIILEIDGKDNGASKVLKDLKADIKSLVDVYQKALNKLGDTISGGSGSGGKSPAKKMTEDQRKELEAQIRDIRDANKAMKSDYELLIKSKQNIDKQYMISYIANLQSQKEKEKALIQDQANADKISIANRATEQINSIKNIDTLTKRLILAKAESEKEEIQKIAKLKMSELDLVMKKEIRDLNEKNAQARQLELQRIKEQKALVKQVNEEMTADFKKSLKTIQDAQMADLTFRKNKSIEINKEITKDFEDGIKKALALQKQASMAPVQKLTGQITGLSKDKAEINAYIQELNREYNAIKGNTQAATEHKQKLQETIQQYREQSKAINDQILALQKERDALKGVNYETSLNSQVIKQNIQDLKDQGKGISDTKVVLDKQTESYGNLGGVIWQTRAAFHAFLDTLNLLVNSPFIEWGKQADVNFQNMNSIAFMTAQELKGVKDEVFQLINDEGSKGLDDLSQSLFALNSAGYKGAEAINLLRESAKTASATLETTEDTLKSTVAILKTYGYTADQARRVQNTLMVGVQDGIFTMKELNQYVGQAISLASEFKDANGQSAVSIEQVTAALVGTTLQGVNMANSVTAINQVFKTFLDPAEQTAKLAKQLGIDMSSSAFETKNFGEVIIDIMEKTSGKDQEDLLGGLFGNIRALKGVFKLAKDDSRQFLESYRKLQEEMKAVDEGGVIARDKAQEEQEKSFQDHLNRLKNKFGVFMFQTFELASAGLKPVIKFLESLVEGFNNLSDPMRTFIQGLVLTVFTLGTLTAAFVTLGITIGIVKRGLAIAIVEFGLTGAAASASAVGVNTLTAAFGRLLILVPQLAAFAAVLYTVEKGFQSYAAEVQQNIDQKIYTDSLTESIGKVKTLLELEQQRFEQGKKLTAEEQKELARAMAVASTDSATSKMLGFGSTSELRKEATERGKIAKEYYDGVEKSEKQTKQITKDRIDYIYGIEEKYSKGVKDIRKGISKDLSTQYENEVKEIKDNYKEKEDLLRERLAVDAEIMDQSKKLSQLEKDQILKDIEDIEKARKNALNKAWKDEKERLASENKRRKEEQDARRKELQSKIREEYTTQINNLDKLINEEKAKEKKSLTDKLAAIETYLKAQSVIYEKYSGNIMLSPTERSELGKKSKGKLAQITTERINLEKQSISQTIESYAKGNEARIKQIETRGILENQLEEDILEAKIKEHTDYFLKIKGLLDRDTKYYKLTLDQKADLESKQSSAVLAKAEATQKRLLILRENDLKQRAFYSNKAIQQTALENKMNWLSFKDNQDIKEENRQRDLQQVESDIKYERSVNNKKDKDLTDLFLKRQVLINEGLVIAKESADYEIALREQVRQTELQAIAQRREAMLINSFEERRLLRADTENFIKEQERKKAAEPDFIKKEQIQQVINSAKSLNSASLRKDIQDIQDITNTVINSGSQIVTQLKAISSFESQSFMGVASNGLSITSRILESVGKIATMNPKEMVDGVIGMVTTATEAITNFFAKVKAQSISTRNAWLENQKIILESEQETNNQRIELIKLQAWEEYQALEEQDLNFVEKAVRRENITRSTANKITQINREFYKKQRELDQEYEDAKLASKTESQIKEETLSERIKPLVSKAKREAISVGESLNLTNDQIKEISGKKREALTDEEKLFKKELLIIEQNFLNDRAKLEEEFNNRKIEANKYLSKIQRVFNEEQNVSELEKLKEKYESEIDYINRTFAEHEGKAKMLANLKIEYEKAVAKVTEEENAKRTKAILDGQDDILKAYKEQQKLLDDMYNKESDRIDKALEDIRKKYQSESDRIREINKLLGQDALDQETNIKINALYITKRDELINQTPGSFYRQTDEEFIESIKKRENALSEAILQGMSYDDRIAEEQSIALTKVAYLTEYKSKLSETSREFTQTEIDIRLEKEKFFELEKQKLKKQTEQAALIQEKATREAEAKRLADQFEKEITNARTLESEYAKSAESLKSAFESTRNSFALGMVKVVGDFGTGMFKVANDFANELATKLKERIPSLNVNTTSAGFATKSTGYGTETTPRSGESYDDFISRIKKEDANRSRIAMGLPPLQFADGGISEGPKSGYAITSHGRELHLNEGQGDNLSYLFKLANLSIPKMTMSGNVNTSSMATNISVTNNFSGMKISSDMDLKKVTTYIENSINNKIRKVM